MLIPKLFLLNLSYLALIPANGQKDSARYKFEIGVSNSTKISRSVMKPYNYLNLKSAWTDWVGFFNPSVFLNIKKKNNLIKISYLSTDYSKNTQLYGQFYDSSSHSTLGSGSMDEYIGTNDFNLTIQRNLTPKSKLKLYTGIGFNLIVNKNKSKENSSDIPPVFSPKLRMQALMTDGFEKRIGYATCAEFTLQYPHKKTVFSLTYYSQFGLHYFASKNIYYKFDNYKFQGTVKTKGDAMMLGIGISRTLGNRFKASEKSNKYSRI